jgi:hypothetical protein
VYDTSSPAGGSNVVFDTPNIKGTRWVKDPAIQVGGMSVEPVKITSPGRAYAFLRAKPNSTTASSTIHLINYSDTPTITIDLTNSFFGRPSNVPMTLAVRMPGSYLASVGSGYSEQTLTGILYGGKTTFTVPVSKDYALLIIPSR